MSGRAYLVFLDDGPDGPVQTPQPSTDLTQQDQASTSRRSQEEDEPDAADRHRQRQRRRRRNRSASSTTTDSASATRLRHIPVPLQRIRAFMMDRHWIHKKCEQCMRLGLDCLRPPIDSNMEKCASCSERGAVECEHKWILQIALLRVMRKLLQEDKTMEEAELIAYKDEKQLGGEWDLKKDYPQPASTSTPSISSETPAAVAGPSVDRSASVATRPPTTEQIKRAAEMNALQRLFDRIQSASSYADELAAFNDYAKDLGLPANWNSRLSTSRSP